MKSLSGLRGKKAKILVFFSCPSLAHFQLSGNIFFWSWTPKYLQFSSYRPSSTLQPWLPSHTDPLSHPATLKVLSVTSKISRAAGSALRLRTSCSTVLLSMITDFKGQFSGIHNACFSFPSDLYLECISFIVLIFNYKYECLYGYILQSKILIIPN